MNNIYKLLYTLILCLSLIIISNEKISARQLSKSEMEEFHNKAIMLSNNQSRLTSEALRLKTSGDKFAACNKMKEAQQNLYKFIENERSWLTYDILPELRRAIEEAIGAANHKMKAIDDFFKKNNCFN